MKNVCLQEGLGRWNYHFIFDLCKTGINDKNQIIISLIYGKCFKRSYGDNNNKQTNNTMILDIIHNEGNGGFICRANCIIYWWVLVSRKGQNELNEGIFATLWGNDIIYDRISGRWAKRNIWKFQFLKTQHWRIFDRT